MAAGELEPARELAERSTELASETDDKLTASGALGTLAEIAMAKGEYDESVALLERGLLLRRALGDKRLIANSLLGLGRVALLEGRHEQATPPLEEGLALARQVKDGWSISVALANLGRVRLYAGDLAAARELLSEGFKLAWDRNDKRVAAECAHALGAVCAAEARPLEAIEIFAGAETLREATGAVLSPTEAAVGERYLTPLESSVDRGAFETAWKTGRSLQSPELYARALCPPPQRSAETVASPTSSS
jgi:tetratricopeptide (TPR) repeat protein